MDSDILNLVKRIHETDHKVVMVTTGVGTLAQSWLFGVAGASRTMLEAHVPYSKQSFIDLIGREPKKYVSGKAVRLLSGYALNRAGQLASSVTYPIMASVPLVGLSCTGAIATDRPKRGLHHAYVSAWTLSGISQHYIQLDKDKRSRQAEDALVSRIIINLLADICGLSERLTLPLLPGDQIETKRYDFDQSIDQLLSKSVQYVGLYSHGKIKTKNLNPRLLLPGSFNPLHHGHKSLANVATKILGWPVAFEISAFNVDKPPLPKEIILNRITQFAGHHPIYVTNAPTFLEKAELFPNTIFVVGFDTAERVLMPKYYNHSLDEMCVALKRMESLNCRFLVAGRIGTDGVYDSAHTLPVPDEFRSLFEPISDDLFREDISSSEIRKTLVD